MPRLHLHAKLLVAFVIVLLPVLGMLVVDFLADLRRTRESILNAQFMTAQAVAMQASETFDAAIGFAWAVSKDPLLQTLEPRQLDPHLKELVERSPTYDSVAVFDVTGVNRGWSNPTTPDEPRLWIGDRPYFQKVLATNAPVVSEVVELRRPIRMGLLVSTPLHAPDGRLIGVFNVVMRTDLLEQRYVGSRLQPGQALFLADPKGRLAFHTGNPELSLEQSNAFARFEPLRSALAGTPSRLARFTHPLQGDEHLGAFVPVPHYPWAVGVTVPRHIAMAPLYERVRMKLAAFSGILLLNSLLAVLLARYYARPVRQLQLAAHALGSGEMQRRVHIATGDELEELGGAFNEMADQIAHRQERELALARIGQALVTELELERIAPVVIEQSIHTLGADAIGLWLAEPERQELTLLASHRLTEVAEEGVRHLSFDAPQLSARAAREERIQVIEDLLAEGAPPRSEPLSQEDGFRGRVAVPLHSRERLVGVMAYFTRAPCHVSSRELEFHTLVGRLFAVAIEKARLFQEVRTALRLREEFMSAAAHELKTPVTTIQTWAELLLSLEALTPRQQKGLTTIARNTRRITRLVEHLFAAVRMAPGTPALERQRFDLQGLLREQVEKLGRTTENPIRLEVSSPLFIHAERQLVGEVVAHLVENALRYSPPGAPVELRAWHMDGEAVVSVHDVGPGVPSERQRHVFEPFYEPLPPGSPGYTGVVELGLYLSRQIVEAHGGHIWLESPPHQGSTFFFSLPLSAAPVERDASHAYDQEGGSTSSH